MSRGCTATLRLAPVAARRDTQCLAKILWPLDRHISDISENGLTPAQYHYCTTVAIVPYTANHMNLESECSVS